MKFKKLKTKLFRLLIHPAIWAIPLTLIGYFLIPTSFDKYKLEEINEERMSEDHARYYFDLDRNGLTEDIMTGNSEIGCYIFYTFPDGTSDQLNFSGKFWYLNIRLIEGDYDNNGNNELFLISLQNDSVLLSGIKLENNRLSVFMRDRFICKGEIRNGVSDLNIRNAKVTDLDGDGFKDIALSINGGFCRQPRGIFVLNLITGKITRTPVWAIYCEPVFADLDKDGKDEIAIGNYAIANHPEGDTIIPYSDWFHYDLMVDNDLQLLYPPRKYDGDFTGIGYKSIPDDSCFLATHLISVDSSRFLELLKINLHGKVLLSKRFEVNQITASANVSIINDKKAGPRISITSSGSPIKLYDTDFNYLKSIKMTTSNYYTYSIDLDEDGSDELICKAPTLNQFAILRSNLDHPVYFHMKEEQKLFKVSLSKTSVGNFVVIQNGSIIKTIRYGENPVYYLNYFLLFLLYCFLFFSFSAFKKLQMKQAKKKFETESRIARLQLITFRSQFEPHFIFNILNNVNSLIVQGRYSESGEMLMNFSKLLRTTLQTSDKISRSLNDEIRFTNEYLLIQQKRFLDRFTYEIMTGESINLQRLVPKMVLFSYVENSIKHGVAHLDGDGKISVIIETDPYNDLILKITDNGIGRKKAGELQSDSTGKGLKIMQEYYSILNSRNKEKITEAFTDLINEDGSPSGTLVTIIIPSNFNLDLKEFDNIGF